jgi:hypothetical protein
MEGTAKLEKVFSFRPRRSERGKKEGVVEGRLKGAILFVLSK